MYFISTFHAFHPLQALHRAFAEMQLIKALGCRDQETEDKVHALTLL